MAKRTKTNETDFQLFKNENQKWIERLGLKSYRITYLHENECENSASRAWARIDTLIAEMGLDKDWVEDEVTEQRIKVCAFHEAIHLLLNRLMLMAENRYALKDEMRNEEEAIIHRLENTFVGEND